MADRYPASVRKLNDLLRAELGSNPRYAWRWSEDLWHVMEVVDSDGNPQYAQSRSKEGLIVMAPETMLRKLLPFHENQWIACALVEINERDGSLQETGKCSWIPISSQSGPVCLEPHEVPQLSTTQALIDAVRSTRKRRAVEMGAEWSESQVTREKQHWATVYDRIRSEATAFYNLPGAKGHVSFPSVIH